MTDAEHLTEVARFESLEPRLMLSADISTITSTVLFAGDDVLRLQYDVPTLRVEDVQLSGQAAPITRAMLGDVPLIANVGEPLLPVQSAQIVLPYGFDAADVVVQAGSKVTLDGTFDLELATEMNALSYGDDGSADLSGEVYEVVGVGRRRGVNILTVNLHPVEYLQETGTLSYFDSFVIDVQLTPLTDVLAVEYRPDEIRPLADQVDNPGALAGYAGSGQAAPLSSGIVDAADSYNYVIITSNALATASADYDLADFVTHKEALGYGVAMVTVEDIYANYTGADSADQVRNFIIDAYNNWETDFVLIGGDHAIVPVRVLWVVDITPDNIDSDFYYQCLDGDFNADGDSRYGEYGQDSVDFYAEVYIGRAMFDNVTRMSNWVYKTISYENTIDDPYRYNAEMLGEWLASDAGVTEYAKDSLEELRTWYFDLDPDFNVDTLYERDQSWGSGTIISHMNSDTYAIYNHIGHGNSGYVMQTSSSTFDSGLTNDKFFFAYSQACSPGYMLGDSIAEHLTTYTRHGAAALVFNSSYGWFYPNYTSGPSHILNRQFWDALFTEGMNQFGVMNADSHEDNMGQVGTPFVRGVIYGTILFGDPSLKVVSPPLDVRTQQLDWAYRDQVYDFTLEGQYGSDPYTWSIVGGALPDGVTLDGSTGVLSGTPTATGEYTFTVEITDSISDMATKQFVLLVLEKLAITTAPSLTAYENIAYSQFIIATGGTPPYSFTLTDGSLPTGLALNGSTGEIYGTTSDLGQYIFSIQVADSDGTYPQTDVVEFTLDVTQPLTEIRGQVFSDTDGDGLRDAGEVGLNGWTVQLVDLATDSVVATTVSADVDLDSSGSIDPETEVGVYVFTDVAPGDYEVRQVLESGYEATTSWQRDGRIFAAEVVLVNVFFHEFDPSDGSIINTFAGPATVGYRGHQGLAVGPNSLFFVDANDFLSPTVWELDLDTGAVIDSDPLTFGSVYAIRGLAYLDGELYIQYLADEMAVWDPATDSLVRTVTMSANINSGLTGIPLGLLYATNTLGQVVMINPADGSVLATLTPGLGTLDGGLAYDDGDLLAMSSSLGSLVYRLDRLTGATLDSFALGLGWGSIVGLGGDALPPAVLGIQGVSVNSGDTVVGVDLGNEWLGVLGDMNADGLVNELDIDLLYANFGVGVEPKFDLDGDMDADGDDVTVLLHDVLNTEYADFNLDGVINATDLAMMKVGFGGAGGWALGDANGDLNVTATDLAILKEHFGFVAPTAPAAPAEALGEAPAPVSLAAPAVDIGAALALSAPAPSQSSVLPVILAGPVSAARAATPPTSPAQALEIDDIVTEAIPLADVLMTVRARPEPRRPAVAAGPTGQPRLDHPVRTLEPAQTLSTPSELTIFTDSGDRPGARSQDLLHVPVASASEAILRIEITDSWFDLI